MTFEVFRDEDVTLDEQPIDEDDEEGQARKLAKEQEEKFPKHIYIKEVVREPKMHYYRVPKLGSYLAIKLEYNSCLFEGALDEAVRDHMEVRQR